VGRQKIAGDRRRWTSRLKGIPVCTGRDVSKWHFSYF